MVWWLFACRKEPEPELPPPPPDWDPPAPAIDCAAGQPAPLLEAAAADAGVTLEQVALPAESMSITGYALDIQDVFALPWIREIREQPITVQCHAGQASVDLDHAVASPHPVASTLGLAYALLDQPESDIRPLDPKEATQDLVDLSPLPEELAQALVPVFAALELAIDARLALEADAPASPEDLVRLGHAGEIWQLDTRSWPDLELGGQRQWSLHDVPTLYDPARVLAYAVEEADLARFAGMDARLDVQSQHGRVLVAGPGDDAPGDLGEVAFYLDLGGNDTYVHAAGSSSASVPVALHLDLGGDDVYGYIEEGSVQGLLPSDAAGRMMIGDTPFSLSQQGRQGSGRFGVGLLFDWGGGNDQYRSLVASQGWGQLGVGVLFDDAGDDVYASEQASQGSSAIGVGLLLDLDGADAHQVSRTGQGFGGVRGIGIAYDGAGDDSWLAEPGPVVGMGYLLWDSWQLPGEANESLVQGAASGIRDDDNELYLSGGVGILRDRSGEDSYVAGIYAQGFGYWQSVGYLLEGGGADRYDAVWHAQGAAAHFGVGGLFDQGTEGDRFGTTFAPIKFTLGVVNDLSVALAVNEGGDDVYTLPELSAGSSTCQGVSLFVDNDGADSYIALSPRVAGAATTSPTDEDLCRDRESHPSLGLFLDAGGDLDTWNWPADDTRDTLPANDSAFGWAAGGTPDELGGAVDGDGETSIHATGVMP